MQLFKQRERFGIVETHIPFGPINKRELIAIRPTSSSDFVRVVIKGAPEYRGYRWGFRNPFTGQMNNSSMSTDEDSAVVTKFCQIATVVFDPSRTAQIIPEVLAA